MTRTEIEKLPRHEYFDGCKCPVCGEGLIAYSGRMKTIEEHCRVLGEELQGSDYLLLHVVSSSCVNVSSVAGVSDQDYFDQIEQSDFVLMTPEVLSGWSFVNTGPARAGDKYWDWDFSAWLPVTVNAGLRAEDHIIIRVNNRLQSAGGGV